MEGGSTLRVMDGAMSSPSCFFAPVSPRLHLGERSSPRIAQRSPRGKGPREATSLWPENRVRSPPWLLLFFFSFSVCPARANVPKLYACDGIGSSRKRAPTTDRTSCFVTRRMKRQEGILMVSFSPFPLDATLRSQTRSQEMHNHAEKLKPHLPSSRSKKGNPETWGSRGSHGVDGAFRNRSQKGVDAPLCRL